MIIRNQKLRSILRVLIPVVFIPGVLIFGIIQAEEKRYAFLSLVIVTLSLVLFATGFEKRKIGTRRLVLVTVMTTLSVAGRMIPFLKPVTAITILTGICLGGESGFLTGALSALLSNMYFGQGPWTPFQMFAWGLIGLVAGGFSESFKKHHLLLYFYGALSGALFSLVMDVWTVVWYSGDISMELYRAAIVTALPFTLLYSVSNVLFLAVFTKPFLRKMDRIQLKYGV